MNSELELACYAGELERVQSLLAQWESINPTSPPPLQSMLSAAARQSHSTIVSFLLNKGAIIDAQATMAACISNSPDVFQALLGGGFDPNLSIGHPGDALILCAGANKFPLVNWLLAHGADPDANVLSGAHSALEAVAIYASPEMADLLIRHGARLEGTNALKRAAFYGRLDMMTYLLDQGVGIDDIPYRKYIRRAEREAGVGTALHDAAKRGQVDAVQLLLKRGANPGLKDSLGRTPLECALENGYKDVVEMLESQ